MKRSLIVAAAATAVSSIAFAQSSVTVYGRVNATVESQKDGDDRISAVQNNASRIGFKGTEDLGGGLKAGFLIEHGFSVDTGAAASTFWGRESNVYLEGGFGKVRLGNMGPTNAYFTTADYISMHNHDTGTSSDAFYLYPGDATNMIAYTSPSINGLVIDAQYGLKENATGEKDTAVLTANWVGGPLHLGASVLRGNFNDKEFALRALYEFGAFTFGAYWARNDIDAAAFGIAADAKRDTYRASVMYTMGAGEFHANFGVAGKWKVSGTTVADSGATQYTLGYNHNLSKRTKVYGFYTAVNNKANAAYNVTAAGNDFSSLAVGIRHNF